MTDSVQSLYASIFQKDQLKKLIIGQTEDVFLMFITQAKSILEDMLEVSRSNPASSPLDLRFAKKGDRDFELYFSSDMLVFTMHTNVFEFSRTHTLMNSSYIKEDATRSFCGVIHVYNFLSDSVTFNRENDLGYLIGRIFVNKEKHYFIDGKQELGLLYNNFNPEEMTSEKAKELIIASMEYANNFGILVPPYEEQKMASVLDLQTDIRHLRLTTAKRLGFEFNPDK